MIEIIIKNVPEKDEYSGEYYDYPVEVKITMNSASTLYQLTEAFIRGLEALGFVCDEFLKEIEYLEEKHFAQLDARLRKAINHSADDDLIDEEDGDN